MIDSEKTRTLLRSYLQEAATAQMFGRDDVAARHMQSVEVLVVEGAKRAHADWVKARNKKTMAAVIASCGDAESMGVGGKVQAIFNEVHGLYLQGKVGK